MATSSILGGEHMPEPIPGKDTDALGPSDNSDSGSDAQGAYGDGELANDSDAAGTGERASIEGMDLSDRDILPDHVERESDATSDEPIDIDSEAAVDDLALDEEGDEEDEDEGGAESDSPDRG
ncbi:hypothetical protein RD110_09440 [Rhodoferax koreense]|uniref:Chemotaxis protein n=1 Tax=Rhodoferax koreensis TaxID=1842727 RepID=A0A1P8JUF7_9BURK|nr:hypothetical protein [Rhodoferax koreense]APW37382.1 hypothetical protein RD110_09440 [Rhodoferax koreense]